MCWFLRGDTNVKYLQDNNVRIWDEWATAEQTAKFGRPEGELGPVYGHQWRNFGATSVADIKNGAAEYAMNVSCGMMDPGYLNDGIDQIQRVVDRIKTNPSCRRLIVSGWNPAECDQVSLPPCHTLFQFRVSHGGTRLNCQLYQRSADAAIGVPFNIASYALLTHMIAQVTGLEVGEFVHTFGDLHIYEPHIQGVKEQLTREPLPLPKLWLNPEIKNINDFKPEDIKLIDYVSHGTIPFSVAI
jgi:thymidylate synthase